MLKCPHCGIEISPKLIAAEIGRHTSEKKKKSSAENGKKGGRPVRCPRCKSKNYNKILCIDCGYIS